MKLKVCVNCVMDTSDINISFDENGVCNHCKEAEIKLKNGWFPNEFGRKKLDRISEKIRKNVRKGNYDSIIGVSGGVDSSYLLHLAKIEMGLNPLVVHVDAGWNSEIAVSNIEKLVKKLNLDLITYVVDWEEIKDLQLAYLKSSLPNQDVPQDHAFFAKLYEIASEKGIKYVITGSNLSSESILPRSWGHDAMDSIQLKYIHSKFGKIKLKTYPIVSYFIYKIYYPFVLKMKVIKPLNFIDYDKNKAIEFLEKKYDWKYYGGKHHESNWTKFFQSYYLPVKFGFDKRKAHLSSMIVSKQITREEAILQLSKALYIESELDRDKTHIAKKLGITFEELNRILELGNKTHSHYPNYNKLNNTFLKLKEILYVLKNNKNKCWT
jgi:N-acetyl sugar amidotransferase